MGTFIDLNGEKFSKLTCIEYLGRSKWKCLCDCGNYCVVHTSALRSGKAKSCGCLRKKYSVDEHYFDKIDTETKAYILGFIASDGNVSWKPYNLKIEINSRYVDVLNKIVNAMDYNYTPLPYTYTCSYKDGSSVISHTHRVNITNKRLVLSLTKYGIIPNKSNVLDMNLEYIPDPLLRHFIRGYWDGDGHISKNHMNVTSTLMMVSKFINIFEKEIPNFAYTLHYRNPNNLMNVTMYVSRKAVIQDLFHYLYADATIYMDRKFLSI